jgi:hypothetical protein
VTTNGPSHTITNKDIYDQMVALNATVTTAVTKMESQEVTMKENQDRIRSLELKVLGVGAGLIAAVTILVTGVLQ